MFIYNKKVQSAGTMSKIIIPVVIFIFISSTTAYSKEFLNTVIHINFGLTYGFTYGDIIDYEHDNYYIAETIDGETTNKRPKHYLNSYGMTVDIVPFNPFILGNEAHAVKFGLRGVYRISSLDQNITIRNSDDKETDYGGSLIEYQSWMVGPLLHYSPLVETSEVSGEYTSSGGFTLYVLYGRLLNAELSSYPSKRANGESVSSPYIAQVDGYKLDIGIGGEVSVCSVNLGMNMYFSYIGFTMNDKLYPTIGTSSSITQFCIEIYMGIPVEWLTIPRVF